MFQNISSKDEKSINNIKALKILKELFKFQNLIIYILTFFISTLSIKGEIVPFGLAMVAACVGSGVPIIGVFISALIGTFIGNGMSALANFIFVSVIYLALVLLFKSQIAVDERNEEMKTGGKLFWAYILVQIFKNIKGVFLLYDMFMATIAAAIIYVFYKIFVNGIAAIKDFKEKTAFSVEELVATAILIGISSLAFNKINIMSINISNVIIIFMIMVLGWKNGMLIGATAGISIGISVSFVSGTSFVEIIMFAISGIFSGLLNNFGKIGVIIGFVLGNIILTYVTNGNTLVMSYFREIFIASLGLLLVPSNINLKVEDLIGNTKLLSNIGETRLNGKNSEISDALKTISNMFYELMNSQTETIGEIQEEYIQNFLDNLEEIDTNIFYEEISKEENGIALDIYKCIENNEIIVDSDLVSILQKHNNYIYMQDERLKDDLQDIIKIANRTYKMLQIEIAKKEERNNNIENISNNIKEVSKVIDDCAEKIVDNSKNEYDRKEKELINLFNLKKIKIEQSSIKKLKNKKFIITLKILNENSKLREKDVTTNIADLISKNLGEKISFQREKKIDEKSFAQVYASEDKYIMQVGSSKISKEGSQVSGDCNLQIRLDDGKYLLAIADGMGSGEKARESSKFVIKMIKKLTISGFEKEESVKLINSALNINSGNETYSSLDVSVLDLFTGEAEFLKNAACTTYIKNKKTIRKISADNLPIGIVKDVNVKVQNEKVSDGDIILMVSDGVLDSKDDGKNDWIEAFLRNVSTNNVQKLSDLLLAEAIDNNYGIAQDDMTIIACKIVKKK